MRHCKISDQTIRTKDMFEPYCELCSNMNVQSPETLAYLLVLSEQYGCLDNNTINKQGIFDLFKIQQNIQGGKWFKQKHQT